MADLDETAKVYEGLFNIMKTKFFAEDYDGADQMASSLLLKADLPLFYRVWCHILLGSAGIGAQVANKQHSDFLGHAQAAVDIINECKNDPDLMFPEKTVTRAEQCLEDAKLAMVQLEADGAFEKSVEEEVEDEDEGAERESAERLEDDAEGLEDDAAEAMELDDDGMDDQLRNAAASVVGIVSGGQTATAAATQPQTGLPTPAVSRTHSGNTAASTRPKRRTSKPDYFKP